MSIALFIPVRAGSERVKNKNNRSFSKFTDGLLQLKLENLIDCSLFDEIIVSTNDLHSIKTVESYMNVIGDLKLDKRPEQLCKSDTDLQDLIKYIPEITDCDAILWTHVTSPFCFSDNYQEALRKYGQDNIDSVIGVSKQQEFIWDDKLKSIKNTDSNLPWPRTQDLQQQIVINNSIFLASRNQYKKGKRIGEKPQLLVMDKISSWDVDTEEDFVIAETLYDRFYR